MEISKRQPFLKNRVAPEIETSVIDLAIPYYRGAARMVAADDLAFRRPLNT